MFHFVLAVVLHLAPLPFFLLSLVRDMMAIMLMIRMTPIVDPIPQFWVTRKCCSTAVPSVITRFPPIRRVSMNSDNDGMKTAWKATAHAAHRQRKDDPSQRLHPCRTQVLACYDQGRVQLFDRIEDWQYHKRQLDVGRHENETEVREEDLLGTDAHEAQELVDRTALTEQTDEGIGLQQKIDPGRRMIKDSQSCLCFVRLRNSAVG